MQKAERLTTVTPPTVPACYAGRDEEEKAVMELLKTKDVILVSGAVGIGKSTFCSAIYNGLPADNGLGVENLAWLDYCESIEYTLFRKFPALTPQADVYSYAKSAEEYLKIFGKSLLVIIDNVDIEAMNFAGILAFLEGLSCKVIIITPHVTRQVPSVYLEKLPADILESVFRYYAPAVELEPHILPAILSEADRHTLITELIARESGRGRRTVAEILSILKSQRFGSYEPAKRIRYFIESVLDKPAIRLLRILSLLAAAPIEFELLASVFELDDIKAIYAMMNEGWLVKHSSSSLKMHPMIAQAVRPDALSSQDKLQNFFSRLILATNRGEENTEKRLSILPHALSAARWMNNASSQKAYLLNNAAALFESFRDYSGAQAMFDKSLDILSATVGLKHPFAINVYHNYANSMKFSGQYLKAAQMYDKAIELCKDKYGAESLPLMQIYMDSIDVIVYLDNYSLALERANMAKQIITGNFGEVSLEVTASMEKIAFVTLASGHPEDAIDILEHAVATRGGIIGKDDEGLAVLFVGLAGAYQAVGDYIKGYFYVMRGLETLKKSVIPNIDYLAKAYLCLGKHFQFMAEYDKSVGFMKDALMALRKAYSESHPAMSTAYLALGYLHRDMGAEGKAKNYFNRYLAIKENTVGKSTPSQAFKNIGAVYMDLGNKNLTLKYYIKALNIAINQKGKNDIATAGAYNDLGLAYMYFGEYDACLNNLSKALKIFVMLYGPDDTTAAVIYNNIALAYQSFNAYDSAIEYYCRSLAIKEKNLGKRDSHTLSTYANLHSLYKKMGDIFNADYYRMLFLENGGNMEALKEELES